MHWNSNTPDPLLTKRRSTVSSLIKFFLFCLTMIMVCLLLYIPLYNKANYQVSKGWSTRTNRDTNLYVLPNNVTIIHEPNNICTKEDRDLKNILLLLIVVCSSTENFEKRTSIRNTWGNYKKYKELSNVFNIVRERYKDNIAFDIDSNNESKGKIETLRNDPLLPEVVNAVDSNLINVKTDSVPEEKKCYDTKANETIQEFDMKTELKQTTTEESYNYEDKLMKSDKEGTIRDGLEDGDNVEFKLVFLMGLPVKKNDFTLQYKIEEEVENYGDVIQEGFIDSYNNLTLKSIMMLKWIYNNCGESVRYILKTDDDMYVNVPNLMVNLKNRSQEYDNRYNNVDGKEYLLVGDLITGAKPVLDSSDKWYSPRFMYKGSVYPDYLSGMGYLFSAPAAKALYVAALKTPYFHLEDIFITGMCVINATPRLYPIDDPAFVYPTLGLVSPCAIHSRVTAHRVTPQDMATLHDALLNLEVVDSCERKRLAQVN